MPFVEIKPIERGTVTGVRVSFGAKLGLVVSMSPDVAAQLGLSAEKPSALVFLDPDPAFPRLKISASEAGPYKCFVFGKGKALTIRVGRNPLFDGAAFKGETCEHAIDAGDASIEIELPRAIRRQATVQNGSKTVSVAPVGGAQGRRA